MGKLFYLPLFLLTLFNLYMSSYPVRHGEVNFFNDVARDFLLLSELDEKKIVLIGPRSSTNGLFHGPLWTYMNYPAYLIGHGDPVIIAWFWIMLAAVFLISSFWMVWKMLRMFPAFVYVLFVSTKMVPYLNGVFHSEATFFFVPVFLFTIYKYVENKKALYLTLHLIILALIIQLEIGIGLQFLILSSLLIIWIIYRNNLWRHLIAFILVPLFLSNLIIFDLRNDLRMSKAILSTGESLHFFITIRSWVENRINNTVSLQLFNNKVNDLFVYIVFAVVIIATILQLKNIRQRKLYFLFPFYYFGYMCLSFFNKGVLLFHYVYLIIPLTALWLTSFLKSKYRFLFIPFIFLIFYSDFISTMHYDERSIGKHYNSWLALSEVANTVVDWQKGGEFGYFVFAPDALAYQPRYAMIYNFNKAKAKAFEYSKKPTTYIIAAPPPADDPYMTHDWWRKVQVKILKEPSETKKFPNGFIIEKFILTDAEQAIEHEKSIELGIHFR